MKVVVLEHFTTASRGGVGRALYAEARAMRDAVAADLAAVPGVRVRLMHLRSERLVLHDRLTGVPTPAGARARESALRAALRDADAALVIAPERDGTLQGLVRAVENEGAPLLGPGAAFVRAAGDKLMAFEMLRRAGLPTPETEAMPLRGSVSRLARVERPFVLKPRDGCGGEGAVLVREGASLEAAVARVRRAAGGHELLLQRFVPGDACSISVIAGRGRRLALPLGRQRLRGLSYRGGETPWRHHAAGRAAALACRAVDALDPDGEQARGYVGVDLVMGPEGPVVIEVNPRLTASYLGLRRVCRVNLAGLMLDAAMGRPLPGSVAAAGVCRFRSDGGILSAAAPPPPEARLGARA